MNSHRKNQPAASEGSIYCTVRPFFAAQIVCHCADIFLEAARRLGLPPEECMVFEDAVNGVEAAKAAGCSCTGITSSFSKEELLAAGADRVVSGFGNININE
jgi:hypothetical protein